MMPPCSGRSLADFIFPLRADPTGESAIPRKLPIIGDFKQYKDSLDETNLIRRSRQQLSAERSDDKRAETCLKMNTTFILSYFKLRSTDSKSKLQNPKLKIRKSVKEMY